jgi:hypothetical protein
VSAARCDFSDLPTDQCGHCQGTDKPQRLKAERTITARYAGACPECFARIEPGDTIGLVSDQGRARPEWYCADCVEV